MQLRTASLEQHIAVFGESGSGKTVLLSSFYGATQESQFSRANHFRVVADDLGQGSRLHRNYLGMKNQAETPEHTRFAATSYSFSVKLDDAADAKSMTDRPFDALRLVWHDYPGEWFEQDVSGPGEAKRRVDTFRSLLTSDVALLLVDGQRLLDNKGKEERYLKSLLGNLRNALLSLKDDLLEGGQPLVEFPRIWIMGLSKCDLLPDIDVYAFRDLLIEKATDEMAELRDVIAGLVDAGDALSMGEDFMLLSSARFGENTIEVAKRVGVEVVLPLAAVLPFERHLRWTRVKQLPAKVAANLKDGAGPLAAALIAYKTRGPAAVGKLLKFVGPDLLENAANLTRDRLSEINSRAVAEHNYLTAALTRFRLDLDEAEDQQVLLRSRR